MRLIDADKFKDEMQYVCDAGGWLEPVTKAVTEYVKKQIDAQPTVEFCPTLREKALFLLVEWAEECGFGYDNFPEDYETYKDEIEGMRYIDGMIYIAERVVENESDRCG